MQMLDSMCRAKQAAALRKREQAKAAALKGKQQAQDQTAKDAADVSTDPGGRGARGGRRGGRKT